MCILCVLNLLLLQIPIIFSSQSPCTCISTITNQPTVVGETTRWKAQPWENTFPNVLVNEISEPQPTCKNWYTYNDCDALITKEIAAKLQKIDLWALEKILVLVNNCWNVFECTCKCNIYVFKKKYYLSPIFRVSVPPTLKSPEAYFFLLLLIFVYQG